MNGQLGLSLILSRTAFTFIGLDKYTVGWKPLAELIVPDATLSYQVVPSS